MKFDEFIKEVKAWGEMTESIKAIILVGSYARGTNTQTSDIDLCILTTEKDKFVSEPSIFERFGKSLKQNIEYYGVLTSVRIWHQDGFEVEYGIADISWISKPLDEGTRKVLSDGYKVIVDKCGYFENLDL